MKLKIEEYLKKYNITCTKTPIMIGVFGTKGKTTTIRLISNYLEFIGKKVSVIDSLNSHVLTSVDVDNSDNKILDRTAENKNILKERIQRLIVDNPEYILIEVHEEPVRYGVFDELLFDYRFITKIDTPFDSHASYYFKDALHEFLKDSNGHGKTFLSSFSGSVEWDEWIQKEDTGSEVIFYFNSGNTNFYISKGRSIPRYKPLSIAIGFSRFLFEFEYESTIYRFDVNHTPFFLSYNVFGFLAFICESGLFDYKKIDDFFKILQPIPGRGEMINLDTKNIILDFNGEDYIRFLKQSYLNSTPSKESINLVETMGYDVSDFYEKPNRIIMLTHFTTQFSHNGQINSGSFENAKYYQTRTINNSLADYIILTRVNPGPTNIDEAEEYVKNNLTIPFSYEQDRRKAIKNAISNLNSNELLVIARRGDDSRNFDKDFKNDSFRDIDIVNEWFEENL